MSKFGIPLRNGVSVGITAGVGTNSLNALAQAILRSFGTDASSYPFATLQGAYQTSAGPAAAAVNDPIGLELDAMGVVGPELVTNGTNFTTTTGWTGQTGASVSAVGGNLVCTAGASVYGSASYGITLVIGKTYKLMFDLISNAGAADMYAFVSDAADGVSNRSLLLNIGDTPGNTSVYFTAITAASYIVIGAGNGGFDPGEAFALNNISCVQVTGNHATQTTAINRPTMQRGLWNFLSQSSNFASGDWIAASSGTYTVNSDAVAGPCDDTLADTITASPTGLVYVTQAITASAIKYTEALWVKLISGSGTINLKVGTELDGGTVLTPAWQMISYSSVSAVSAGYCQISFVLPNSSVVAVYSAGLFQGTLTADQVLAQGGIPLTTSAAGSNPTAGPYWARFDGSHDSLALTSTLTAVAGTFVCCARADKLHFGTLIGNGGTATAEPGISIGTKAGGQLRAVFGNSSVFNNEIVTADTYSPGEVFVLSVQWDMSFVKVRKNSGTTYSVANTLGDLTSSFLGSLGMLGALGGDRFSGGIYAAQTIKGVVPAADLLVLEKAAAQRAGLVI